jgi:hypothetical protein
VPSGTESSEAIDESADAKVPVDPVDVVGGRVVDVVIVVVDAGETCVVDVVAPAFAACAVAVVAVAFAGAC